VAVAVTITEQRYGPNTGTFTGWLGLVMCVGAALAVLMQPDPGRVRFGLVLLLVATVIWSYLLRPRVIIRETAAVLLLRNAFSTWELPLAAVTRVRVKAITRIELGEDGYDGIGVGRRVRTMVRGQAVKHGDGFADAGRALGDPPRLEPKHPSTNSPEAIADLMTEQVLAAAERAQESGQQIWPVRRTWAWPEIVVLAGLAAGFAASFLF
jgi:hypothetical protein